MSGAQDAFFSSPSKIIAAGVAAFAVPVVVIALLINFADTQSRTGAGTDSMTDAAISARLAPVAQVNVSDANAPKVYKTGEAVFKAVCSTCHATGMAGAPKFGNAGDWAPRIAQGYDTLVKTALSGTGAMPPRGGTSPDDYSDYEIARAVVYMANAGGAHFSEPAAPPAPASPAEAAASAAAAARAATAAAISSAAAQIAAATAPAPASGSAAAGGATQAPAAGAAAPGGTATTAAAGGAAAGASDQATGRALFQQVCAACHMAGVAGAPKFGDKEAWAPRLKDPIDTIYNYALHGKGAMPPKGGSNASDADVKAAVDYMISAAK